MSQDNFDVLDVQTLIDECLIAKKIYGRCKQQDCLRPNDANIPQPSDFIPISSSLYGGTTALNNAAVNAIFNAPILPGEIIEVNKIVNSVTICDFKTDVKVVNICPPGQFSLPGFYDVTIKYTFTYNLTLYDVNCTAIPVSVDGTTTTIIPAYTTYTKQIQLEGGVVDCNSSIAIADTGSCCPTGCCTNLGNLPYVYVQAIANPLVVRLADFGDHYHIDVVIGLFTIIQLYRITSMSVASNGPIEVPQCQPSLTNDPCSGFNQLLFPYDDFDPPYRKC